MPITYRDKIVDRQVGRNAELFALAVGETKKTPEERYPFLRILISILEQARPEWHQSPTKDRQLAHAIFKLSRGMIPVDETAEVVRLRDMERGYLPLPEQEGAEASVEGDAQNEAATGDDAGSPAGEAGTAQDAAAETTDAGATAGSIAGTDTVVVTEPVEAKAAETEAESTEVVTENAAGDSGAAGVEPAEVAKVTGSSPDEAVESGTSDDEGVADSAAEAASGEQSPEETKPRRRGRPRRNP